MILRALVFGIVPWKTRSFRGLSILVRMIFPCIIVAFALVKFRAGVTTNSARTEFVEILPIMVYNVCYGLRDLAYYLDF